MATRQYIGARYVPVIIGPWDAQQEYEPLSVVLYNNSSYTSKRQVPAGIVPTDTNFWALTGNYNAQIDEFAQAFQEYKDTAVRRFNSLVDMVGDMSVHLGDVIRTLGYYDENDGGSAVYLVRLALDTDTYSATTDGSTSETGLVRLAANYDGGVLVAEFIGSNASAAQFGVKENIECTDAAQALFTFADTVVIDRNFIVDCDTGINLKNGQKVIFEDGCFITASVSTTESTSAGNKKHILNIENVSDIEILGNGGLNGNRANQLPGFGTNEWFFNIRINNAENVHLSGIYLIESNGDGIVTSGVNNNILIENCVFDHNRRQGISHCGGTSTTITGCTFNHTEGTNPAAGIDIEPDAGNTVIGTAISNCIFTTNNYGILVSNITNYDNTERVFDTVITGCLMRDNTTAGTRIQSKKYLSMTGCLIDNISDNINASGVWITNSENAEFNANTVRNSWNEGFVLQNSANIIISDNTIESCGGGVRCSTKCDHLTIRSNIIINNRKNGIYDAAGSEDLIITGNFLKNNRTDLSYIDVGGEIRTSKLSEIVGNRIINENNKFGYGIYVDDATGCHIYNNFVDPFVIDTIPSGNQAATRLLYDGTNLKLTHNWQKLGDYTGNTPVALPAYYDDLYVVVNPSGNNRMVTVLLARGAAPLVSRSGYYQDASNNASVQIALTTTQLAVETAYFGGVSQSGYAFSVYYR